MRKTEYLSSRAINQKSKGTLLSQTFKAEEIKVPLFFFYGSGAELWPYSDIYASL